MPSARTPSVRRQELERVATRLFAERGYHATSMEDLAQAVGMRRGSLYSHITAKEELLLATVERGAEAFDEAIRPVLEAEGIGADERLRRLLRAHLGVVAAESEAATCFLWEWRHLGEAERVHAVELRDAYQAAPRRVFEEGVAEGVFRPDLDIRFATLTFLSVGNWASTWFRADGSLSPDELADRFYEMLLRGVGPAGS